ncbi:hypothetical protein Mgra_00001253, partial [Meloidogyne graminicola]
IDFVWFCSFFYNGFVFIFFTFFYSLDHADYYNSPQTSKQSTEDEDFLFEELIHGKIVRGSDGKFYVEIQGDVEDLNFNEFDIKLIEDNGQQTLLIEKREEHDYCIRRNVVDPAKSIEGIKSLSKQVDGHHPSSFNDVDKQVELTEEQAVALDSVDFGGEEIVISTTTEFPISNFSRKQNRRVFGSNKCPECSQSFTNMARLERHLSVHQCIGAYICPLCGKTYKYEYNLFYHWRRTCRGLNEMIPAEERKAIEINALRHLIEDISKKHSRDHLEYFKLTEQYQTQQNEFQDSQQILTGGQTDSTLNELTSTLQHQTHFVEGNSEVFSEDKISNSIEACLAAPYTFNNKSSHFIQPNKSVQSFQCTECLRSFSSLQRLQKHLISSHYSSGTHPCLFCGNRFKYEYNLFFHYRNVCPYSLELLNEETRRELDASSLKKLIRQIATDKNFYLKSPPLTIQNDELLNKQSSSSSILLNLESAAENGDSAMRREMMKKIIRKSTPKSRQKSIKNNFDSLESNKLEDDEVKHIGSVKLPPLLLQPSYRPDLPEGIHCPICSIVFYGLKILIRHLTAAHPKESSIWEKTIKGLENNKINRTTRICPKRFLKNKKRREQQNIQELPEQDNINDDNPPLLEIEQ